MSPNIILGAGIAGLSAAHHARGFGCESTLYEAAATPGGLLDSFSLEGWQFDNCVHLSFASEPEVRAVFDRTPYIEHDAAPLNWDHGRWLRHPVHNNLYPLPEEEKNELITDFLNRPDIEVNNYKEWLLYQYGTKITERWPVPYTRKYWTIDPENMGINWIGNRMRRSEVGEVLAGAKSADTPSTYYISRMRYPVHGGYRSFINPLLEDADIKTGYRAVAVDWKSRQIHFSNGKKASYTNLINTIPLPVLVEMMVDVPHEILELSKTLFATRVDLISMGLSVVSSSPAIWFYIYDSDIMAARVYSPSIKSTNNVPEGCSSLQFEIYSSVRKPLEASVQDLKQNCVYALEKMGLAAKQDILFIHHKHVPYGNVVFDLGMEERRDRVKEWVRSRGIELAGRFGEWDYLWSNQCFMSGMRAVESWRKAAA